MIPLQEMYLKYLNDFLTVERFANYYGMDLEDAQAIVTMGRDLHRSLTTEVEGWKNAQAWCVALTFSNNRVLNDKAQWIARNGESLEIRQKELYALAMDHVDAIFAMAPWAWDGGQSFDVVDWFEIVQHFEKD